jgi:hypothetical protein
MNRLRLLPVLVLVLLAAFPTITLQGAGLGVTLWFQRLLPSILPGMIMSGICLRVLGDRLRLPFIYAVFTGLFCGHPLGAKACAALYGNDRESAGKTQFLLALVSMPSPMFIMNYVYAGTLGTDFTPLDFAYVYLPSVILIAASIIVNRRLHFKKNGDTRQDAESHAPKRQPILTILDDSIMEGFETITRLGGYIILFSILGTFLLHTPIPSWIASPVSCILEITSGIPVLKDTLGESHDIRPLAAFALGFGGISCLLQTKAIINGTYYSIKKYACHKLLIAAINMAAAFIMAYAHM